MALKLLMTIMTCDNEAFESRRQLERDESEKEDSRRVSAPVVAMTRRKNGGSWEDSQPSTPLSLLSCRASRRRNIDVPPTVCPSVSCSFSLLAISLSGSTPTRSTRSTFRVFQLSTLRWFRPSCHYPLLMQNCCRERCSWDTKFDESKRYL